MDCPEKKRKSHGLSRTSKITRKCMRYFSSRTCQKLEGYVEVEQGEVGPHGKAHELRRARASTPRVSIGFNLLCTPSSSVKTSALIIYDLT